MEHDPVVRYEVRVPGNTAWSDTRSFPQALRERDQANGFCQPGHEIFAVHASGDRTGPYPIVE